MTHFVMKFESSSSHIFFTMDQFECTWGDCLNKLTTIALVNTFHPLRKRVLINSFWLTYSIGFCRLNNSEQIEFSEERLKQVLSPSVDIKGEEMLVF